MEDDNIRGHDLANYQGFGCWGSLGKNYFLPKLGDYRQRISVICGQVKHILAYTYMTASHRIHTYIHTYLKRADGSGEEVVVLQTNHVLVLGVSSSSNLVDVLEQIDHQSLVRLVGLAHLSRQNNRKKHDESCIGREKKLSAKRKDANSKIGWVGAYTTVTKPSKFGG